MVTMPMAGKLPVFQRSVSELTIDHAALFWSGVALEVHRRDFTFHDAEGDDEAGTPMDRQTLDPERGGPTQTSRAFAMTHLAMYDAWLGSSASSLRDRPYLSQVKAHPDLRKLSDGAAASAIAAAASNVLMSLFGRQHDFVNAQRHRWLEIMRDKVVSRDDIERGRRFGEAVADAMISFRQDDPEEVSLGHPHYYVPKLMPGHHREDPYNPKQGFLGSTWGTVPLFGPAGRYKDNFVKPFGQSRPEDIVTHADWAAQVVEVRKKGAAPGTPGLTRTDEETVIGTFWGYDGARNIGTPPRLYNQCVHTIIENPVLSLSLGESVKLLALCNMAMADSGILAWNEKYHFALYRPVIGAREYNKGYGPDNGASLPTFDPALAPLSAGADYAAVATWLKQTPSRPSLPATTDQEANWKPLGAPQTNAKETSLTPNFPAYPSGHATFGTSCFQTVRHFLGTTADGLTFDFVSDELSGVVVSTVDGKPVPSGMRDSDGSYRPLHTRQLTLEQAIHENAVSRIYLGVHWRIDAEEGVRLGNEIATTIRDILTDPTVPTA